MEAKGPVGLRPPSFPFVLLADALKVAGHVLQLSCARLRGRGGGGGRLTAVCLPQDLGVSGMRSPSSIPGLDFRAKRR